MNFLHVLKLATIALLLGAVGRWPYDYYTLLRFVVCPVAASESYFAFQRAEEANGAGRDKQQRRAWAFVALAVLFNPFVPVHLAQSTWNVIDIGVGVALAVDLAVELRVNRGQRPMQQTRR